MQGRRLITLSCLLLLSLAPLPTLLAAPTTVSKLLRNEAIESQIRVNLMKTNARFSKQNIAIHCFDGVVLLTGEVDNSALKQQAAQVARKTPQVRQVHNQLSLEGSETYLSRLNDSWLATKVRSKIMMNDHIKKANVHVTSSRGHIYLMGTLSPAQAREAMRIAQQVDGVQGVTDLISYRRLVIDEERFY
jgi:osmotically-inducible protein OsmY